MRNISEIMDQLEAELSDLKIYFKSIRESLSYTAPEAAYLIWQRVAGALEEASEKLSLIQIRRLAHIFSGKTVFKLDDRCNWKCQEERLIYTGKKGNWHTFAKVSSPNICWCEVLDEDLHRLELTLD